MGAVVTMTVVMGMVMFVFVAMGVHSSVFYFQTPFGAALASAVVVGGMTTLSPEFIDASTRHCHYLKRY
jgi:hypothetical protein